jgi:flagellar basal body-associated protein FliL
VTDDNEIRPMLIEIRDIVLRHEQVNRKEAAFRRRILMVLLFVLALTVLAMGYGLMLVHSTTREIRQQQRQQQLQQKVASLQRAATFELRS